MNSADKEATISDTSFTAAASPALSCAPGGYGLHVPASTGAVLSLGHGS